jgi:hypothetical protein
MCQRTCPNFARPVVAERFLASPEDLRMAEGILYGGSVISISVVGVRPVPKLFPGQPNEHESELVDCSARQNKQFVLTRQSTTSRLPSRVASSDVRRI